MGVQRPLRILLVNDEIVRVYEVEDPQWKAVIRGAAGGLGKIVNVDFGSDENEVLVFSDFAVKVTIWSLKTNRGAEIRDPKAGENFDFRPSTGHLAIITRAAAHDNLMLLAPGAHQASKSVELPTVDAQGIKWSPDGRWLAIWDAAGSGYRIAIYTADGHLFRSYEGGHTSENIGMGIKSVAWDPNTTFLAVGDYENDVTLLNSKTVSALGWTAENANSMKVLPHRNPLPPLVHRILTNRSMGGADRQYWAEKLCDSDSARTPSSKLILR